MKSEKKNIFATLHWIYSGSRTLKSEMISLYERVSTNKDGLKVSKRHIELAKQEKDNAKSDRLYWEYAGGETLAVIMHAFFNASEKKILKILPPLPNPKRIENCFLVDKLYYLNKWVEYAECVIQEKPVPKDLQLEITTISAPLPKEPTLPTIPFPVSQKVEMNGVRPVIKIIGDKHFFAR
ncbi:hypothetical protein ACFLY5_01015 [Patescibacteria group bacterium]